MMNKNFNYGAANNNSNNGKGEFIMATNTIKTMEAFADTIKMAMEANFGNGVRVTVQKVTKTNGVEDIDLSMNRRPTQSERVKSKELIIEIAENLGLVLSNPEEIQGKRTAGSGF